MTTTRHKGAAIVALAAELSALADLREWEPVQRHVQNVVAAMGGGEGLTERDVLDVRLACARWGRMNPRLREFYAAHVRTSKEASVVLWHLLFRPAPDVMTGPRIGRLHQLWLNYYGERCSIDFYPRSMRTIR